MTYKRLALITSLNEQILETEKELSRIHNELEIINDFASFRDLCRLRDSLRRKAYLCRRQLENLKEGIPANGYADLLKTVKA